MIWKMWLSLKLSKFQVQLFLFLVTNIKLGSAQNARETINHAHIKPGGVQILHSMSSILLDCWTKVDNLEKIRQLNLNSAPYEVGYLSHIIQNKYRKMLDRYYSAVVIGPEPMFIFELIILLEEIERGYLQLEHIIKMLLQVERKYEIYTPINAKYRDLTYEEEIAVAVSKKKEEKSKTGIDNKEDMLELTEIKPDVQADVLQHVAPQTRYVTTRRTTTKRKKFNWAKYYEEMDKGDEIQEYYKKYTKKPTTRWWWPIEYGWEIDYAWSF